MVGVHNGGHDVLKACQGKAVSSRRVKSPPHRLLAPPIRGRRHNAHKHIARARLFRHPPSHASAAFVVWPRDSDQMSSLPHQQLTHPGSYPSIPYCLPVCCSTGFRQCECGQNAASFSGEILLRTSTIRPEYRIAQKHPDGRVNPKPAQRCSLKW